LSGVDIWMKNVAVAVVGGNNWGAPGGEAGGRAASLVEQQVQCGIPNTTTNYY
jgi:hypothetical protein